MMILPLFSEWRTLGKRDELKQGSESDEILLSEKLWQSTADIRKKVLDTNFIKKICDGTLDPVKFGQFVIQDAMYCYYAKEAFDNMANRTKEDIFCFFARNSERYSRYYEKMFKDWNIGEPSGIHLNAAAAEYIDGLHQVAKSDMKPAYYIVAYLPCMRLWPWIGGQINNGENSGVYQQWVQRHFGGSRYREWEELVNQSEVDWELAETLYRNNMICEYRFFDSVDPQS